MIIKMPIRLLSLWILTSSICIFMCGCVSDKHINESCDEYSFSNIPLISCHDTICTADLILNEPKLIVYLPTINCGYCEDASMSYIESFLKSFNKYHVVSIINSVNNRDLKIIENRLNIETYRPENIHESLLTPKPKIGAIFILESDLSIHDLFVLNLQTEDALLYCNLLQEKYPQYFAH